MMMKALSIRQPWPWAIIFAGKPVENRDWLTRYRGPLLLHASKGMTRAEYDEFEVFYEYDVLKKQDGPAIPAFNDLQRGGIVGICDLVDCVTQMDSPWFFGKYGFVLKNARRLPFTPMKGSLGLIDVDVRALGLEKEIRRVAA